MPEDSQAKPPFQRDYELARETLAWMDRAYPNTQPTEDQYEYAWNGLVDRIAADRPDLSDPRAYAESVVYKASRCEPGPTCADDPVLAHYYQTDRERLQASEALARGQHPDEVAAALVRDRIARLGEDHPDARVFDAQALTRRLAAEILANRVPAALDQCDGPAPIRPALDGQPNALDD